MKPQEGGAAAVVQNDDGYESSDVLVVSTKHLDRHWIMDSGCSFHMTPNGGWFEDYKEINGGQVLLGNNKPCKVIGIGSVRIKTHDGIERILLDVRHVPELTRNLISLGMLDQHGFSWKGEKGVLKVSKGLLVVMKGVKDKSLYLLQGSTVIGMAATVAELGKNSSVSLWHKWLGHVSERGLHELEKQGLFGSEKLGGLDFCEHCVYGKAIRVKFSKLSYVTKETLGYVHSDLWGPSQKESLGGGRYFISFIDDCSRKVWV